MEITMIAACDDKRGIGTKISGDYSCNKFLPETGGALIGKTILDENTWVEHYDLTRRDI